MPKAQQRPSRGVRGRQDVGELEGRPYVALEYLEGEHLRERTLDTPLSATETMRIGLAIAEALKEAHDHQVCTAITSPSWALGVMLYELLCDHPPYGELNVLGLGPAVRSKEPVPPLDPMEPVSERFEALCRRLSTVVRTPPARISTTTPRPIPTPIPIPIPNA
jgi:serine/threonine protein kinase